MNRLRNENGTSSILPEELNLSFNASESKGNHSVIGNPEITRSHQTVYQQRGCLIFTLAIEKN